MGFEHLPRQSTADFLTSLTNPAERVVRLGFVGRTPRNADEFAAIWQASSERAVLLKEILAFDKRHPPQQRHLPTQKGSKYVVM